MTMIEEAYVSFETAKLLKEKGFDGECSHYYRCHDKGLLTYRQNPGTDAPYFTCNSKWLKKHSERCHVDYILAPTQQMAMR